MSNKSTHKDLVQKIGIGLFSLAFLVFLLSLTLSHYKLDTTTLQNNLGNDYHWTFVAPEISVMEGKEYASSFAFLHDYGLAMKKAQVAIQKDVEDNKGLTKSDGEYWNTILQDYKIKDIRFPLAKASSQGFLLDHANMIFLLSILLGIFGALLYILPKSRHFPGIKNNHIYHSKMHNRGWLGIATGIFLIGFYILLYFYPEHLVNWVILVDPVSKALSGNPASQWFLYGFLYTIVIIVMGIRMIIKYRHNRYQIVRTFSVMFFQTAFAFLIPEILVALNKPYFDFKNIWPLDYDFFFEWNIQSLMGGGTLGIFMLFWGIALFLIGVPVISYFYGKRWYCSWVCGCGGLAETLGDPYRQLSDKSVKAWKIERWMIHTVLGLAILMTLAVLYTFLPPDGHWLNKTTLLIGSSLGILAIGYWFYARNRKANVVSTGAMYALLGGGALMIAIIWLNHASGSGNLFFVDSFKVRQWYGFGISSIFAGVVGTGFYPLMGNRVWCRFGCPLAAYLGIVQKFKSRFRITTNGGQCISCGNCSTYCEMGIDVRAYAQKGQDIVRASCVGCGVCSAVCPRGVLRLENSAIDVDSRTQALRTLHITPEGVSLVQ
ncbi:MAG: 4Fe-4S binding protein [Saprospiraceae bacterium]